MLRIKRAVQASFNTETSFIAAQASAARKGTEKPTETASAVAKDAADPMATMEREMGASKSTGGARAGGAPTFVASTMKNPSASVDEVGVEVEGGAANPDAIEMDEDEF